MYPEIPSLVTHGVRISVKSMFVEDRTAAHAHRFAFAYHIVIQNESLYTVQLLRRHWNIFDAFGTRRVVIGDGVIGEQPVIEPGQAHGYISGCVLPTPQGKMEGHYVMLRVDTGEEFPVRIPGFLLGAPYLLN